MKTFFAILLVSIILVITIIFVFNLPATPSNIENPNWLIGWDYRKRHSIEGSYCAGTDYQIKIITYYGEGVDSRSEVFLNAKCQRSFDDVRFTDDDGLTMLDYWLETKNDGDKAVFWVKVNDNLDVDQDIFIYYGNKTVASASNINKTFPFADDFSADLNSSKWRLFGAGKVTISNGECKLESVPNPRGWIYIIGKTLVGTNYAVRFRSLVIEQADYRWTHHGFATIYNSTGTGGRIDEYPNYITASQEATFYAWSFRSRAYSNTSRLDLSNFAPQVETFYTYEIQRNGSTNVLLKSNDIFQGSVSTNVSEEQMGAMFSADNGGSNLYAVTVVDWVVIRKYTANEPAQSAWGAEETIFGKNILVFL
ncbi:MAG: DUF2341 domain-containing protein [Candidatus Bathyarchaeota archaeon]|nr:DUF2341 domain-containing protein [Candidatus Bathyarchaeota archaeon]